MPRDLSAIAMMEKNKLASDGVWLIALEFDIPGLTDSVRLVRNTENITWRGVAWVAFPFEIDDVTEQSKTEVPQVVIRIGNVNRAIEAYIHDYDDYCKSSGYEPLDVHIYVLNSNDLANNDPVAEHIFQLTQPKTTPTWATFTLGTTNPFARRYPQDRVLKNHCRFRFRSALCGYTGSATSCDHTLARCRALGNSARFGGFPGASGSGLTQ